MYLLHIGHYQQPSAHSYLEIEFALDLLGRVPLVFLWKTDSVSEPRALLMLGNCSVIELYPEAFFLLNYFKELRQGFIKLLRLAFGSHCSSG